MKKIKPSERRARAIVNDLVGSKTCGSCQECCEAVAVHEIRKDEYQICQHQCSSGCSIYKNRPSSCREYYCLWRIADLLDHEFYRPDKLRAIFDFSDEKLDSKPYIRCWQLDAYDQILTDPDIKRIAYRLAIRLNVPVLAYFQNNQRSVHLIRQLLVWRKAFENRFPKYPVYELKEQ